MAFLASIAEATHRARMMITIRRFLRRVWPRSPLVVPGLLVALCVVVWILPYLLRIGKHRYYFPAAASTVDPTLLGGPLPPGAIADDDTYVHDIWGTHRAGKTGWSASTSTTPRSTRNERPMYSANGEPIKLINGTMLEPLLFIRSQRAEKGEKPIVSFYDPKSKIMIDKNSTNSYLPTSVWLEESLAAQPDKSATFLGFVLKASDVVTLDGLTYAMIAEARSERMLAGARGTAGDVGNHENEHTVSFACWNTLLPDAPVMAVVGQFDGKMGTAGFIFPSFGQPPPSDNLLDVEVDFPGVKDNIKFMDFVGKSLGGVGVTAASGPQDAAATLPAGRYQLKKLLAEFLAASPNFVIYQRAGHIGMEDAGKAFRTSYPWMWRWLRARSWLQAAARVSAILFLFWLIWVVAGITVLKKELRAKGYTGLSMRGIVGLYLLYGSALHLLPPGSEVALLPDVDVTSWRSLRKLLKQRIARE